MREWFGIASGLVVLAGAPFYLVDIIKGTTKPERMTWLIWSVLGLVAFVTQVKLGGHWSLVYVGLGALGNMIVLGLSFWFGIGGWNLGDKLSLIVATVGITGSLILHSPLLALWGVVLADFAGAILTLKKTFANPESETTITWLALGLSAFFACFAVGKLSYELLLYPVYFTIICWAVPITQALGYAYRRAEADKR